MSVELSRVNIQKHLLVLIGLRMLSVHSVGIHDVLEPAKRNACIKSYTLSTQATSVNDMSIFFQIKIFTVFFLNPAHKMHWYEYKQA